MIKQETLPPVTISTGDYDRLAFLASFGLNFQQDRPAAAMLANELIRATVVTPRAIPPSVAVGGRYDGEGCRPISMARAALEAMRRRAQVGGGNHAETVGFGHSFLRWQDFCRLQHKGGPRGLHRPRGILATSLAWGMRVYAG